MTPTAHLLFGLAAQSLLVAWLAWQTGTRLPFRYRRLFAAGCAMLTLIPVADNVSAAMALRALWGDPSMTTVQLLTLSLAGRRASPAAFATDATGIHGRAALALGVFGLIFYTLALGLGDVDPYRLGYAAWPVAAVLGLAALIAWRRGQPLYLWLFAIDLAAYAVGLPESPNLWDTLFDPLLVGAALVTAVRFTRLTRNATSAGTSRARSP